MKFAKRDLFIYLVFLLHHIADLPHDDTHSDMTYADMQFFFLPIEVWLYPSSV